MTIKRAFFGDTRCAQHLFYVQCGRRVNDLRYDMYHIFLSVIDAQAIPVSL
jgi:hypothetical protein